MVVVGVLGVAVLAMIALAVAGVTLWSGWRAAQDELLPGFKTRPPGARSLSLTLLGVVLPVLVIAAFTLYLTIALLQLAVAALQ